jgi:hypothetical protein
MSLKLWKDIDDDNSVATLPECGNFKARGNSFLTKQNPFSYEQNLLTLADGCAFEIYDGNGWKQISNRGAITINPALNLDEGDVLAHGKDYYMYLISEGENDPEIIFSRNATFPAGCTMNNTRKIGGFHFGSIRIVDENWTPLDPSGQKYGNSGVTWKNNVTVGIIPNSLWDLKNRPKTAFGGLVKIGNFWLSIYNASIKIPVTFFNSVSGLSVSGGELQSVYGQFPATGTEGLNQFNFVELAGRAGMRLPSYQEWLMAAIGNPQGEDGADNYGWTKISNTARARLGCAVNPGNGEFDAGSGIKRFAISAYNCVDMIGNVWEWLADYSGRYEAPTGGWQWHDQLGAGMGKIFAWQPDGLIALLAGGLWDNGALCGPRSVNVHYCPWNVHTAFGARLACDTAA